MKVQRGVEFGMLTDGPETPLGSHVIRKLAAQVVVEATERQSGEEIPRQVSEAPLAAEPADGELHIVRCCPEELGQVSSDDRGEAFRSRQLRHLAKICPAARPSYMAIDRLCKGADHLHQARGWASLHAESAQAAAEILGARRERDLSQQPKGPNERRISGYHGEAALRSLCRCRRDGFELSSSDEQLDDLVPFLGGWKPN
jgi:hypothetical protein